MGRNSKEKIVVEDLSEGAQDADSEGTGEKKSDDDDFSNVGGPSELDTDAEDRHDGDTNEKVHQFMVEIAKGLTSIKEVCVNLRGITDPDDALIYSHREKQWFA